MKISFLWDGISLNRNWKDGLWLALQHLKEKHEIRGFEPYEEEAIHGFRPDVILYWGALTEKYKPQVVSYPYKKAICFAGGPIEPNNVDGFDLYFTESDINEREFTGFGKPWMRAFGINEQIFKPLSLTKQYDAIFFGAHALWKRNELFAKAVGSKGMSIGQFQEHEKECYEIPEKEGCKVIEKVGKEILVEYINQSHTALNTSSFWGGGQRMTLEAMACNVPPIVMKDSPKNCEYVEESGVGLIVNPNIYEIREAIEKLKLNPNEEGRNYVLNKYTGKHYATALERGLKQL